MNQYDLAEKFGVSRALMVCPKYGSVFHAKSEPVRKAD
jgi:hypothetical protein